MSSKEKGSKGEAAAAVYLEERGFKIIKRNFKRGQGEVDIIAVKDDVLHFIEVKSWKKHRFEDMEYSLNRNKQRKIISASRYFLSQTQYREDFKIRYDILFLD
ncbi:MAG: YraN family protein, partial [Spirochaetota bacterium]